MFCPKCGTQNPEEGKFCRSCGTDLGNVSQALTSKPRPAIEVFDRKGRPVSLERAIVKMFTGIAFLVVTIALAFSGTAHNWWFWMLIPAFTSLGAGVAQYIQLKNAGQGADYRRGAQVISPGHQNAALPPPQTEWANPESRYRTGDLVPPSVTEGTTRHLDLNSEGQTVTLPKKD